MRSELVGKLKAVCQVCRPALGTGTRVRLRRQIYGAVVFVTFPDGEQFYIDYGGGHDWVVVSSNIPRVDGHRAVELAGELGGLALGMFECDFRAEVGNWQGNGLQWKAWPVLAMGMAVVEVVGEDLDQLDEAVILE